MKQGLFKRIFILYGAILLLATIGTELYIAGTVREDYVSTLRNNLAIQASLIAPHVPFRSPSALDGLCKRIKTATRARATIIALNGRVLGDSDHDPATMENHSDRIEVQQAKLSGSGMAIRHSHTLGYDLLYVAAEIVQDGSPRGYIRLSIPLKDVDARVDALRIRIMIVVSAILIATGLFSLWQIDRLRRLTTRIRDFAAAVARGNLTRRLFISRSGEFDEIAESLNTMSADLQRSIAASDEEKRRLQVILRNIPEALIIADAKGIIRLSNTAARLHFGEAVQQEKPLIEAVRNAEFLELLDAARTDRKTGTAEFTVDQPEKHSYAVRVSPLSYREGELSGFVAVFHDITRLVQLEQVRKDFVANISHEIKTPVTAISGFADTLLDGALDDREHARPFLQTIKANSDRINNLVDDLMTISMIELGVIQVRKTPVAVTDVAGQVLAVLSGKAAEKRLQMTTAFQPAQKPIMADKDRLIQIFTNLIDNAIKFTESGGITVGSEEQEGKTSLYVADTGIGIPQRHLPRIGERFYRVDPSRSRTMGGTGLGLAIVKHLVKAHGWDMEIESTVGKGTKIRIIIQ